jgi:hypothetical protein
MTSEAVLEQVQARLQWRSPVIARPAMHIKPQGEQRRARPCDIMYRGLSCRASRVRLPCKPPVRRPILSRHGLLESNSYVAI